MANTINPLKNLKSLSDPPQKRKANSLPADGIATRPVKRRASKACQCCRSRKVRCNVTEHGAPCTNCRLDEVECIVSESRRKKKWNKDGDAPQKPLLRQPQSSSATTKTMGRKIASRSTMPLAASQPRSRDVEDGHVPHSIYQTTGHRLSVQSLPGIAFSPSSTSTYPIMQPSPSPADTPYFPSSSRFPAIANIPYFIKPLPPRIGPDEIQYLERKGALTVPSNPLRNELIRNYIEFVHPYMPLIDLYEFVMIINSENGAIGRISLILYQAVMFAGCAFVDMQHLFNAGYTSRKQARKDFFQKTRLLYDFDYESDRVSLVQALLLLTYYYETPDDQKDTWHWMGVATSVAHTIGLHRNPERSNMDPKSTRLWKRIWWSTYMRDRLIALGMRRPTRIKAEDYDVPMMTLDDFDLVAIPEFVSCVPMDCKLARDTEMQRKLAVLCIEKAKLCLCISQVLSKQYCVLNNNQGLVNDRTTMMLLPKKLDPETSEVKNCHNHLQKWFDNLPEEATRQEPFTGEAALDLNTALLHLVYYTTLSALHRPQVLPSSPASEPASPGSTELLECSRANVRKAATSITSIVQSLDAAGLVKFLPTTGVTVLLPAIIIHLLDIKAPDEEIRRKSLRGFCQCMNVMNKLRDMYAAADYSTAFLEAAIRKAGIQVSIFDPPTADTPTKMHPVTTVEDLVDAGRRLDMASMPPPPAHTLTPLSDSPCATAHFCTFPVEHAHHHHDGCEPVTDEEVARRLETFLATSPPDSDHTSETAVCTGVSIGAGGELLMGFGGGVAKGHHAHHHHRHHHGLGHGRSASGSGASTRSFDSVSLAATGTTLLDARSTLGDVVARGDMPESLADNAAIEFKSYSSMLSIMPELEQDDFDALLNLDAIADRGAWSFDDGGVHGFTVDMDWLGASAATGASVHS